jgi:hypothetical protein
MLKLLQNANSFDLVVASSEFQDAGLEQHSCQFDQRHDLLLRVHLGCTCVCLVAWVELAVAEGRKKGFGARH